MTKSKYFYKLLIIILIVATVPVMLLSYISSHYIDMEMKDTLGKMNYYSLSVLGDGVDITMAQINDGCRQMTLDYLFDAFLEISPKKVQHYETMTGPYSDDDLKGLGEYIKLKSKIYDTLKQQKYGKPFIDSTYYYDIPKQLIFTDDREYYSVSEFYDTNIPALCEEIIVTPFITEPRKIVTKDGTTKEVITLIYGSVWSGDRKIFIVNIDGEKLSEYVFSQDAAAQILILSDKGNIIAKNAPTGDDVVELFRTGPDLVERVLAAENGDVLLYDNIYLIKYTVNTSKWTYVNIFEPQTLFYSSNTVLKMIFYLSIILVILTSLIALLSSKVIYRPIYSLSKLIKEHTDEPTTRQDQWNIISYMERHFSKVVNERGDLKSRLDMLLPYYREKIMLSILYAQNPDPDWLDKQVNSIELGFNQDGFVLFLFSIDVQNSWDSFFANITENILLKEYLEQKADMDLGCKSISLYDNTGCYILICNITSDEYKKAYRFATSILKEIKDVMGCIAFCGISSHYAENTDFFKSRWEAQEAIDFAMLSEGEQVHFYSDISRESSKLYIMYTGNEREKITHCIKNGNCENAINSYKQFLSAISVSQYATLAGQSRSEILKLLTDLCRIIIESGDDVEDVCPGLVQAVKDFYDRNRFWPTQRVIDIIEELCDYFRNDNIIRRNKKMDHIIQLVEDHYTENIGLSNIAEMAGMNPDYLGRLFKEYTGKTFVEYVTNLRINRSKELLLNSKLKIKQIGEEVGYPNCNYFIKVFKQHTTLTPKEYQSSLE